jgi:aspartate/methionine/tyrosine aminotransferase
LNEENIIVTNGSAEANFVACWGLLKPGDEVVMMMPNYRLLDGLARSFGCQVKPFCLLEEQEWAPDLEQLEKQLTNKTRMIAICNPNNPTGAILSLDAMKHIASLAERYGCYILSDEIYIGSELNGKETTTFLELYDRSIIASGLAKSYALPGLRIGWLAGPKEVIDRAWHHHDYTTICSGLISQYVANIALQPDNRARIFARGRRQLNANLPIIQDWVSDHREQFRLIPPKAGGMALVGYNLPLDSNTLVTRLREAKSVFVAAGDWFGVQSHLRFGIGVETRQLEDGMQLVDDFFRQA